jgi:carbonic anhydrase
MKMKAASLLFFLSIAAGNAYAQDHASHWSYKEVKEWGACSPAHAECKLGKKQSPVDILTKDIEAATLGPMDIAYQASQAEVINNGHTIQVGLKDGGFATFPSGQYKLLQVHFHNPSEEKINGKNFPLVAHLVHQNTEGKLAVLAVLFKEGKTNKSLQPIFSVMPSQEGRVALAKPFDTASLLPSSLSYYAFTGSLTTPPCSEDVAWHVLMNPVDISKAQLASFKKLYSMNARPVQPLNGRVIQRSN